MNYRLTSNSDEQFSVFSMTSRYSYRHQYSLRTA